MKKALIIEDDEDNLKLIKYALKHAGYEAIFSNTGEKGIELAVKELPSFIIMDINLPGIDGIETMKRLKKTDAGKDIPIFAVTSRAMVGDKETIISAGCNGYFEKPIDPLSIMDDIKEILKKK